MARPSLAWFHHDLRVADNPALTAAVKQGGPVIPVYIGAPAEEGTGVPGAASRWVSTLAQPIGIEDLANYLLEALDHAFSGNPIFEIGGADRVSYGDVMQEYARQRGLTRLMIRVPVLTPRLSSLWLGLVTPVYARVGRKIVDSVCHATVVKDPAALHAFSVRPLGIRDAIQRALRNEAQECAHTRWSDAFSVGGAERSWGGVRFGSRLIDSRSVQVPVPPSIAFTPIRRIGGTTGWYYGDWLWRLRGALALWTTWCLGRVIDLTRDRQLRSWEARLWHVFGLVDTRQTMWASPAVDPRANVVGLALSQLTPCHFIVER